MNHKKIIKRLIKGKSLRQTLGRAIVLVLVSYPLFKFVLLPIRVSGFSMEPTYPDGSINAVNTLRFRLRPPRRGDAVIIELAGRQMVILKRIAGLPGERLAFREGVLLINGQPTLEPYARISRHWNIPEVKIGPDEFFVIGDDRSLPPEFYAHGRVKRHRIIGGTLF